MHFVKYVPPRLRDVYSWYYFIYAIKDGFQAI